MSVLHLSRKQYISCPVSSPILLYSFCPHHSSETAPSTVINDTICPPIISYVNYILILKTISPNVYLNSPLMPFISSYCPLIVAVLKVL